MASAKETDIAEAFLKRLGAPNTPAMRLAVIAWLRMESGTRIIGNNPWNISYAAAQNIASSGGPKPTGYRTHDVTGQKFAVYGDVDDGGAAAAVLLTSAGTDWRRYDKVVAKARAGDARGFLDALAASAWDAGRYGTKDGGANKLLGVFTSLGGTLTSAPGGGGGGGSTQTLAQLIKTVFGSAFSVSRGFSSAHDGIDLSAAKGTPVYAVASGTVSYARNAGTDGNAGSAWAIGGGNVVNVDIAGNKTMQYAHLDRFVVRSGQTVTKGQLIGYVGATGAATGPHLHFGVWDRSSNKMLDPRPFLAGATQLGGFNNLVSFPTGHIITAADVDTMMETLKTNGWFDGDVGGISENITRQTLLTAVGKPWDKALQDDLQRQLLGHAENAVPDVAANLAGIAGSLADVTGAVLNPGNWIRILALVVGGGMAAWGTINVLRASG